MHRRLTVFFVALATLLALLATPAAARDSYISRSTGRSADASWTQVDGTAPGSGPFGNVHVGYLGVNEVRNGAGDVFVYIDDFDCPAGELPGGFGHGIAEDEPPYEDPCVYVGSRFGEAYGLSFTMDRKLSSATLVGTITMVSGGAHGEGGQVVGNPAINMTWTGIGTVATNSGTYRWTDGGTTYTDRFRSSYRQATVDGTIGAMTFDPNLSGGTISTFSSFSKGRTK